MSKTGTLSTTRSADSAIQFDNTMEIHALLREYVKRNEVNPWYNSDVERAIVERDLAYRVWKRRKTPADRTMYKEQRK
jgi:hypothetical protein